VKTLPCGCELHLFDTMTGGKSPCYLPGYDSQFGGPRTPDMVWCTTGHGWIAVSAEQYAELKAEYRLV
jgi:hypothetical protein